MRTHDRLLSYGKTYQSNSREPLVLVIGREPSSDADLITDTHGIYDFDDVHNASFWNVAHRYLAVAAGLTDKELKQWCRESNRSPLIIGDALPIGVDNKNSAVSDIRGSVSHEEIDHHVTRTLELSLANERVNVILLAGHLGGSRGNKLAIQNLEYANASFHKQALELDRDIHVANISFLTDLNAKALRQELSQSSTSEALTKTFSEFFKLEKSL